MSKYTSKAISAANSVASGAAVILVGGTIIGEYANCSFTVENCASIALEVRWLMGNGDLMSSNALNVGLIGNSASQVAANSTNHYRFLDSLCERVSLTACATASIGSSLVKIHFFGRKSD